MAHWEWDFIWSRQEPTWFFLSDVLREIDSLVGKRGRSAFLAELARQEVRRRRLLAFFDRCGPAWKPEDHPELKKGAAAWVSKMRREEERARRARTR